MQLQRHASNPAGEAAALAPDEDSPQRRGANLPPNPATIAAASPIARGVRATIASLDPANATSGFAGRLVPRQPPQPFPRAPDPRVLEGDARRRKQASLLNLRRLVMGIAEELDYLAAAVAAEEVAGGRSRPRARPRRGFAISAGGRSIAPSAIWSAAADTRRGSAAIAFSGPATKLAPRAMARFCNEEGSMTGQAVFVRALAGRRSCTLTEAKAILDEVNGLYRAELMLGNAVDLQGLGRLKPVDRKARLGRNPHTGAPLEIAARRDVKFKAALALKEEMNRPPPAAGTGRRRRTAGAG
jgi:nucleoid DNA-binding protein